jgi:hypothetical protein
VAVCFGDPIDPGASAWADAVVPDDWERCSELLSRWREWAAEPERDADRVLIVAPFARLRELPGGDQVDHAAEGWRGSPALPAWLLLQACSNGRVGHRFSALLPSNAFAGSLAPKPREALLAHSDVLSWIEAEGPWNDDLGVHASFRMALLTVAVRENGVRDRPPARFLRLRGLPDEGAVRKELGALFGQAGGATPNGYVVRESLDPSRPLQFSVHDPQRNVRHQHLRKLGEVRRLGDVFDIRMGMHVMANKDQFGDEGVPVLSGRDVAVNDDVLANDRRLVEPDERSLLRTGDLCVAGALGGPARDRLAVRVIEDRDLPMVAAHSVLVLRAIRELDEQTREFLVDYLRSPRAAALLRHETTGGLMLPPVQLAQLPVPLPDRTLLSALADLRDAQRQLQDWGTDVERAMARLMADEAADAGVLELHSAGQLLRHRVAAARQLDDLDYRIRTLFPFPVALPWRRAQTADHDLDGYQAILGCAETLAAYLAALGVLVAKQLGTDLGALRALRTKIVQRGVSMADWTAILQEVAGKNVARKATADTPLVELTEFLRAGGPAEDALVELTDMRNDNAHNRGPRGSQVAPAFDEALRCVHELYRACEWLIDYPVRLVEDVRWDSYGDSGDYRFRELMGDHYLVPQRSDATATPALDRGRLYIRDRTGELLLLSPLVVWHECDHCHLPSAFVLDAYDAKDPSCRLRATDHNHTVVRTDVVRPFTSLGLLPEDR